MNTAPTNAPTTPTHPYSHIIYFADTPEQAQTIADICNRRIESGKEGDYYGAFFVDRGEYATGQSVYATAISQGCFPTEQDDTREVFWEAFIAGIITTTNYFNNPS